MPACSAGSGKPSAEITNQEKEMSDQGHSYQEQVGKWAVACFGETTAKDRVERNHRFLEESLELVQSLGCTKSEALQLVEYVFSRDVGEPYQELGGVMVTLGALSEANGLDMVGAGQAELARDWSIIQKIRAKHLTKPRFSPLPGTSDAEREVSEKWIRHYANNIGVGYDELMEAVADWLKRGDYLNKGELLESVETNEALWDHYQRVTGTLVPEDKRYSFFSCSC
jgi:hypothetical protein